MSTGVTDRSRRIQTVAGIPTCAIGILVLAGWLLGVPELARLHPSFVMMKANAAIGFILLGGAILLDTRHGRARLFLGGLVALLGFLTTLEWLTGWNPGLDEWIVRDQYLSAETGVAGRMSLPTAICFLLLGGALVLIEGRSRNRFWIAQSLALIAWLLSLAAFTAYFYQVALLLWTGIATAISPQSALLLLLSSTAILARTAGQAYLSALTRGGPGSIIFRQQLLPLILLTLILGGIILWGERQRFYPIELGALLYGFALVVSFLVFGWHNSRVLNRSAEQVDQVRRELEQKNRALEANELRLREADEKLVVALESGEIGVLDWLLRDDRIELSEIGQRLFGRLEPPSSRLALFSELESMIHPDDRARFRSALEKAMQDKVQLRQDFRIIRADGSLRWLNLRGQAVYDLRGEPERFSSAISDITRRKTEETRIAEILASITSGFIALDRNWRLVFVNPSAERILGYRRDGLIGTDFREISRRWSDQEAGALEERCRQAMVRGVRSVLEFRDPRTEAWYEARVHPSESGVSIVFDDVTERRRAEETLRRSEAKFRRLVESNLLGIFTYHADGTVTNANDAFLRMIGYSREDFANGAIRWRDLTPPEWSEYDNRALREQEVTGGVATPFEKEYIRKDGTRVRVYLGAINFEGAKNEGIAYVLDVTERHRLFESEREHRVRAEAATRARDDLVAMVSHDLKNPIGAIMINAQLLIRRPGPPDAVHRRAEAVLRASRRMENLVRDILNVSRIEAGSYIIELYAEEVSGICQEALQMIEPLARAQGIRLRSELPNACCPEVAANRGAILQVLSNLLGNALKFTPRGGEITLRAEDQKDRVLVSVSDTGCGIAAESIAHVFDRYWQAKETRRIGAGLGLAIVKGIVEAHGGQVCVDSKPGKGSSFYFTLLTPSALPEALKARFHNDASNADQGFERSSA